MIYVEILIKQQHKFDYGVFKCDLKWKGARSLITQNTLLEINLSSVWLFFQLRSAYRQTLHEARATATERRIGGEIQRK